MTAPAAALERLRNASKECLVMIGEYYDIDRFILHRDGVNAFRDAYIPPERVVAQHAQLLDIDASMRQAAADMRAETKALSDQLLFETIREDAACLMKHNARLCLYGSKRCDTCSGIHLRVDAVVVRVWPKSVLIRYRRGTHTPRRARYKMDQYALRSTDDNAPYFYVQMVSDAAARLRVFDLRVSEASMLPRVLNDIVVAYVGIELVVVDGHVAYDCE